MKLKTIEIEGKTYALVQDGKPVYDNDGSDVAFDAPHAMGKISELNREAQTHREAKEAAEAIVAKFKDIDPEAARNALETIKNIDESQLIDAGKVQEIKDAAVRAAEEQKQAAIDAKDAEYKPIVEERDELKTALNNELIGGGFARSKFISEKVAIPSDLMQAQFGKNFKVEGGALVGYDTSGNKIYSNARPGELATFDEALQVLVDQYPNRNHILKGRQQRGSGADHTDTGNGDKTITRSEFDKLDAGAKNSRMMEGYTVVE